MYKRGLCEWSVELEERKQEREILEASPFQLSHGTM